MDSRKLHVAAMMALLCGCQQGAEVDFVHPRLASLEAASLRVDLAPRAVLAVALIAQLDWRLLPETRVSVGSGRFRLGDIRHAGLCLRHFR